MGERFIAKNLVTFGSSIYVVYANERTPHRDEIKPIASFLDEVPPDKQPYNRMGQRFKFEYIGRDFVAYRRPERPYDYYTLLNTLASIRLGDFIQAEMVDHEVIAGYVDCIGSIKIIVRQRHLKEFAEIIIDDVLEITCAVRKLK